MGTFGIYVKYSVSSGLVSSSSSSRKRKGRRMTLSVLVIFGPFGSGECSSGSSSVFTLAGVSGTAGGVGCGSVFYCISGISSLIDKCGDGFLFLVGTRYVGLGGPTRMRLEVLSSNLRSGNLSSVDVSRPVNLVPSPCSFAYDDRRDAPRRFPPFPEQNAPSIWRTDHRKSWWWDWLEKRHWSANAQQTGKSSSWLQQ